MGMNKKSWEPTNYQKDRLISSINKVHQTKNILSSKRT